MPIAAIVIAGARIGIEEANLFVRDHAVRNHHDGAEDRQKRASPGAMKEKQDRWTEQNQKNQQHTSTTAASE